MEHRIFETSFASVYPHYVTKVERKGHSREELDFLIMWLTGFSMEELDHHKSADTTFRELFDAANLNQNAARITGVICGVRVEEIEDPLMQKIRYLDKIVDELASGKPMAKIMRTPVEPTTPQRDPARPMTGMQNP
nr:DUF2200 domain-containing protein [Actinomycetales bacterium]